jgi:DNA-binding NarL/FixJ family response regulator
MASEKRMILIVDDSLLIVKRLIDILKGLDNIDSIKHAGTYAEANALFGQCQPDIVFLDINLPDKSGIELLSKIKKDNYEIKVVMFTNHSDDYYKTLCSKLGANYFIDKSTDFEFIPELISSFNN